MGGGADIEAQARLEKKKLKRRGYKQGFSFICLFSGIKNALLKVEFVDKSSFWPDPGVSHL